MIARLADHSFFLRNAQKYTFSFFSEQIMSVTSFMKKICQLLPLWRNNFVFLDKRSNYVYTFCMEILQLLLFSSFTYIYESLFPKTNKNKFLGHNIHTIFCQYMHMYSKISKIEKTQFSIFFTYSLYREIGSIVRYYCIYK